MNLTEADKDVELEVTRIRRGRNARNKLNNMGIREGVRLKKVSQQAFRGPIIVRVGGSRVALGHRLAGSIKVKEVQ